MRPSSQSSIWADDTTGTSRSCAEATMSFAFAWSPWSVCVLTVTTPYQPFEPSALSSSVSTCGAIGISDSSVTCVIAW